MRGLRTNEGAKFEKYFYIVQEEAKNLVEFSFLKQVKEEI